MPARGWRLATLWPDPRRRWSHRGHRCAAQRCWPRLARGDIEAVTDAPGHRVRLPCASAEAEACDEGATPAPTRQRAPRHSEDAISAQRVLLSPPPHDPRP